MTGAGASRSRLDEIATGIDDWLGSGALQAGDGAVCGWRDTQTGERSPAYPEITGYFVGWVAQLPPEKASRASEAGAAAAAWLVARWRSGDRSARPERTGRAVYPFDIAMQAHGLIRYGSAVVDDAAVTTGLEAANLLVDLMGERATLPTVVPGTATGHLPSRWSTTGSVHMLKAVLALLSAAELGVTRAAAAADRLVRAAVDSATPIMWSAAVRDVVSLHALCYAAEGLWAWGVVRNDDDAVRRSRELAAWVWRHRLPGGGLPGFVRNTGEPATAGRQLDVTSQALRLAWLHGFDPLPLDDGVALADSAWRCGSHAAIVYRPDSADRHTNCWASMFASQALTLASGDRSELRWCDLV